MLKRKDKILISAMELMDIGGLNAVTTKRIAEMQGVTEPALYRQYKGKQDIINHMIDEFGSYDQKIINTIRESDMSGEEAIIFYVQRFSELYQNYSELTTIMYSMDIYRYNEDTNKRMTEIYMNKLGFLEDIISKGIIDGSIKTNYEANVLASIINGLIFSVVYEWRLKEKEYLLVDKLLVVIKGLI
jgi:AcrR family transcriptional regulator